MKLIIDRFEGNIAIIELPDGRLIDCPKGILPANAEEGDIINIVVNKNATNTKLRRVTEHMNKLFKD